MKNIAALLTVHNRKNLTLKCLEQLQRQSIAHDYNLDVYLTDDGCTDGTSIVVKNKFPEVHIIKGDGTLFWNRGMHLAWETAHNRMNYDFYFWVNDDTELKENCLNILLQYSSGHNDEAIIVGSCCSSENHDCITYGGVLNKSGRIKEVSKERECDLFNGNIVLVSNKVYAKIGQLTFIYHHAHGDYDYAHKAKNNGIKIFVVPGIMGICNRHANLVDWRNYNQPFNVRWKSFFSFNRHIDYFRYLKRNYSLFRAVLSSVTSFLHMIFPRLYDRIRNNKEELY